MAVPSSRIIRLVLVQILLLIAAIPPLQAAPDLRFDVVWFCCPCYPTNHFCQAQFDHLNWPSQNGHYLAMPTDTYRADIIANGNVLAAYYNTFDDGAWSTNTGLQAASNIDYYVSVNFTNTGPRPDWLIINELSSGTWPGNQSYRTYVTDAIHALANTYGYKVIVYSPFPNPGANGSDWQKLAADACIAVENYLGGQAITNHGFSVSWCQSQYQSSITSYGNLGVPKSRLMLGEHFGQTTDTLNGVTVTWGRNNVTFSDWDSALAARSIAAENCGFPGYLSYAWYSDAMLETDTNMIHFEDTYSSFALPSASPPLSPPYIIAQPQSQSVPPGGNAAFSISVAGNASLTYQWKFNGTNLSGASQSSLTVSNVSGADVGPYSVVVSNSAGSAQSAPATLLDAIPPPIASEPFAAAVTPYSVGSNLIGQTNAAGQTWYAAGSGGNYMTIAAGNLTVPGLAPSTGNSVQFGVLSAPNSRFGLGTTVTSGTLYYSFLLRVDDLGTLNSSGGFFAAFNNSTGSQTGVPSVVGAAVQTRLSGSGYNIGLKKAASGSVFDTTTYAVGQTVFIVGSYTFNTASTNDDEADLWIAPPPATFGSATAPSPTLSSTTGSDISGAQIASFILFGRGSGNTGLQPAAMVADELRIGTNWAGVTPPAAPPMPPLLGIALSGGNVVLSWPTNSPGFTLQYAPALIPGSNLWTMNTDPTNLSGGFYSVTSSINAATRFFRLQSR